MSFSVFGMLTSDPNLLPCELARLQGTVSLGTTDEWHAGVGSYAQDTVLLRAYPGWHTPREVTELDPAPESPVVLYHAQSHPMGTSSETAQPLRFGSWLFVGAGSLPEDGRWRENLESELPGYLQSRVSSYGASETVFAYFLKKLRETGRTEDPRLPASIGSEVLAATARGLAEATLGRLNVVLLASNGHLLLATPLGGGPLFFKLLEGSGECPRHPELGRPENDPQARQHRRCRSLAIASNPSASGWRELVPGHILSVDEKLTLRV